MTFQQLARELCLREGKKHQVNIAQMSEILRCLCEMISEDEEEMDALRCILKRVGQLSFTRFRLKIKDRPKKVSNKRRSLR